MVLTLDNIRAAMGGKALKAFGQTELRGAGETVLKKAYVLSGRDPQLALQADDLGRDMAGSFPHLTIAECVLAVKAGVAGEIGTTRVPSYAAVMQWLEVYDRHPMTADARKRGRKPETPRRVTPEEGLAMMRDTMPRLARERWDSVRTTGAFPRHCLPHVSAQIYDWLKEEGRLSLPAEVRRAALDRARNGLVRGTSLPVGDLEAGERLTVSLAKHMALEDWMRAETRSGRAINLPPVRRIYE